MYEYEQLVDEVLDELTNGYDAGYDLLDKGFDYAKKHKVFEVTSRRSLPVPRQQGRRLVFRRDQHPVVGPREAIKALFPPPGRGVVEGLWVQSGKRGLEQVRNYVRQLFPNQQITISDPEAHRNGQSHVHITVPRRGRSKHIFYGHPPRPDQDFFD